MLFKMLSQSEKYKIENIVGKILCGDSLTELRKIPNESISCTISSPPYYGLRDYLIGKWEGGDPTCENRKNPAAMSTEAISKSTIGPYAGTGGALVGYKGLCGKCGAKRIDDQIGLEETPEEFIQKIVDVFHEVKRVLHPSGTLWLNMGDGYSSKKSHKYKSKNLLMIPFRVALAMQ